MYLANLRLVEGLNKRLTSVETETGLFLAEGPKGVGKSHDLVIPLHLVGSTAECQDWSTENGLTFSVPAVNRVMSRKFTDFPLDFLWSVIGQELGVTFSTDQPPDINQLRAALEGKKLVVIFDELESGVRAISNDALRQKNINFLQMLSEESNREPGTLRQEGAGLRGRAVCRGEEELPGRPRRGVRRGRIDGRRSPGPTARRRDRGPPVHAVHEARGRPGCAEPFHHHPEAR